MKSEARSAPGLKLLGKRFGYMAFAQWGSGLLAGLFILFLARTSAEAFGLFALAMALGVLVTMLTGAGFENYLVPKLSGGRVAMRRVLLQSLVIQAVLMVFSLVLLGLLCAALGYEGGKTLIIMLIAAGMGPAAMAQSFFALCRVLGRQDTEMRIRVAAGFCGSMYGILALWLGASLPLVALFKLVEAAVMWLLIAVSVRWRFAGFSGGWRDWALSWRDGMFFFGIAVCGLLYNKLCFYMLDHYGGSRAVGLFNAPWEIVDGLCILVSGALIEKVLFPLMASQWRKDAGAFARMTRVTVRCLILLGLFAGYFFWAEGDRILPLLYGEEYAGTNTLLRVQIPCILAAFLHNLAACMLLSMRLHRPVFLAYASGLLVNIILCLTLIPEYEALGAAWAISGTKVWMMLVTVALAMRFGLALGKRQIGAALLAAGAAWAGLFVLQGAMWREAAEIAAVLPLLVLAAAWIPSIRGIPAGRE